MTRVDVLGYRFVDSFPDKLTTGVLYVAPEFATMSHLCCCGCGREVVTPLSPKDWKMTFDGESISVHPSIGSWSLPCQSHYVIRNGRIQWAGQWTDEQIQHGRERDLAAKREPRKPKRVTINDQTKPQQTLETKSARWIDRLLGWFRR